MPTSRKHRAIKKARARGNTASEHTTLNEISLDLKAQQEQTEYDRDQSDFLKLYPSMTLEHALSWADNAKQCHVYWGKPLLSSRYKHATTCQDCIKRHNSTAE
jgi:hypothetical protein